MSQAPSSIRRRNAAQTKQQILAAAKQCFSDIGYANTGIRDVAAVAGVSYALVGRYYGSKAGLLEAALSTMFSAEAMIEVERSRFGENVAGLVARASVTETTSTMTVLSAADPVARAIAKRLLSEEIIEPLTAWLGEPFARERAVAVAMLASGFVTHSRLIPLLGDKPDLRPDRPIVRWLARALQQIVDDPDQWRSGAEPQ